MNDLMVAALDYGGNGDMASVVEFLGDGVPAEPLPEMNGDEALPNRKEAVLRASTGVHATLKTLRGHLEDLRRPDGSKTNPARSCQDIKLCFPQKTSGHYWIDPNQGSSRDAIRVFCDMDSGETCISANPASLPRKSWWSKSSPSGSKPVWFGADMNSGSKFLYGDQEQPNTAAVQLKLLQLLSSQARQNITYHCRNSVAHRDTGGSLKKALILQGSNGQELRAQGNPRLRYTVTEDGCSNPDGQWKQTVVEYRTQSAIRLPVLDVAPLDVGKAGQEFGLDIGPVCFS